MVIVGALVRIEEEKDAKVKSALKGFPGAIIQTFIDPTKLGFVFEAESLNQAHGWLKDKVPSFDGVLSVSTVYANFESLAG